MLYVFIVPGFIVVVLFFRKHNIIIIITYTTIHVNIAAIQNKIKTSVIICATIGTKLPNRL